MPRITVETLQRFNVAGPRYTSYPTANEFTEEFGAGSYREHLARAASRPDWPLSLYLHLPFCEERCHFCACNVIISPDHGIADPYLARLERELSMLAQALGERRMLVQYHWGGGTPTYLSPDQILRLDQAVRTHFLVAEHSEIAVEVHPRVTTDLHLRALSDRGFNRLSLGIQDFDPKVQAAINRHQDEEQTVALIAKARALGFAGINVDLIYGLPFQSELGFARTLRRVLEFRPDRVAVYSFAFVPWLKAQQRKWNDDDLPSVEEKFARFLQAADAFLGAGYEQIGMDHFALPDDELATARQKRRLHRNFMGYTVRPAPDQVSAGISAISDVAGGYFQNTKKITKYEQALDQGEFAISRGIRLCADDELRREVITSLMCNFWVDYAAIEARHGIIFADYFADALSSLRPHADEGFVTLHDHALEVRPSGRFFVRNFAMPFDRFLQAASKDRPTFSKTV